LDVIVVGLNHRTVPLDVLERMTVTGDRLPKALHDLVSRDDIAEAVVLSTCNRTEVYVVAERFHPAVGDVRNVLSGLAFLPPEDFARRPPPHRRVGDRPPPGAEGRDLVVRLRRARRR
jgi:glutamyl-tRNA reductase